MITVRQFTSDEVKAYQEQKYDEFLKYYYETDIAVNKIYKLMGLNNTCSTVRFIRKKLKDSGENANSRWQKILKGEWLE